MNYGASALCVKKMYAKAEAQFERVKIGQIKTDNICVLPV